MTQKWLNLILFSKESRIEHNSNRPQTPDKPWIILIIGGSGSGKTYALINLINQKLYTGKTY